MLWWMIGGFVLAVGASAITLIWWRVGDTWADAEHKKFGPAAPRRTSQPTVIRRPTQDPDRDPA